MKNQNPKLKINLLLLKTMFLTPIFLNYNYTDRFKQIIPILRWSKKIESVRRSAYT